MCYWHLVGRGRDAAKYLTMSFANLGVPHIPVRVVYFPHMPLVDTGFHGAAKDISGSQTCPTNKLLATWKRPLGDNGAEGTQRQGSGL